MVNLSVVSRDVGHRLSRAGNRGVIPAVTYCKGMDNQHVFVNAHEFAAVMRSIKKGHLSTTVFTMQDGVRAIVKGIQYCKITCEVLHLDFQILGDLPVKVKVPIDFVDVDICAGVKVGGVVRVVKRSVLVLSPPNIIPSHFNLSVEEMQIGCYKCVCDVHIGKEFRLLCSEKEVVVVLAKR